MTNNMSPRKNRLSKAPSSPRTWSEPEARAAIAAVIVWPGPNGSAVRRDPPVPPATIATTIVSPIARENATMRAATMPETAAAALNRGAFHVLSLLLPYLAPAAREHLMALAGAYRDNAATG